MIQIGGHKTQNSIGWASVKDKIKIWRTRQTAHLGFIPVIIFSLLAIRVYKGLENEPMEGNNSLPPPPGNNVNTENNFLHRHNLKIQKLQ